MTKITILFVSDFCVYACYMLLLYNMSTCQRWQCISIHFVRGGFSALVMLKVIHSLGGACAHSYQLCEQKQYCIVQNSGGKISVNSVKHVIHRYFTQSNSKFT